MFTTRPRYLIVAYSIKGYNSHQKEYTYTCLEKVRKQLKQLSNEEMRIMVFRKIENQWKKITVN
jgi:hypothetical protein